ncbi:isoleucyl-tRNA synthetase [Rhizopus microsporus var. microsporus]|uniref:Isoleucine--tRNA ligase, mitochondrial n=1 Tax=Rhizopus microsporus var. microsporus TaxID=86635 RepID=A0A1X0QNR8_RHIZD|nr:isoleucyl-tRNA synthetase [Rhizopus microsporus var. microsporus]
MTLASARCLLQQQLKGTRRAFWTTSVAYKAKENPYTKTLLLPKTSFPLRADAANREHLFRDRCTNELYPWQLKNNPKDLFILHDGPPYANGNVHAGHALNKITKDIINRYKLLQGHKIYYRPGWDCHGLPIELKTLEMIKKDASSLSPIHLRELAKKNALVVVESQKEDFMSWGVMGDWNNPYLTLQGDFEIRQLRVLKEMVKKGYIYRQLKPVYWSPSSKSALAEAELEYKDNHVSKSIHVQFPIVSSPILKKWKDKQINALIWTTTPWTIPSNRAVCVHPDLDYCVVEAADKKQCWIVGKDRLEALEKELEQKLSVLDTFKGNQLVGSTYQHPLSSKHYPILAGNHVTAESGTALVHTAPGHGMEDYEVCLANNIQPFSLVNDEGKFTKEAGPHFEGKFAFKEGNDTVINLLENQSFLVKKENYIHKYPYDWRTKQPVMLRATAQWFANVENLQEAANSIEHIISVLNEKGTDAWWNEKDDNIFVAPEYRNNGKVYKRGYDTMDVWFDSGSSWTMLQNIPGRDPNKPVADVYLEGSDQHRGWFQSSLLTSNEKGDKMSKSLGNTIEPALITRGGKDKKKNPAYGSDVLRLWVASCDYTKDMTIGPSIIATISDNLRKIRTTARFLLGNLHDFELKNYVDYDKLAEIDKYMLYELYEYNKAVTKAFDEYSFYKAVQHVQNFTNNTLSSFYFDTIKDRLYNDPADCLNRRMAQTVLYEILRSYTTSIAPFVCHTAEEIFDHYKHLNPEPQSTIFKTGWLRSDDRWYNNNINEKWSVLLDLKSEINQTLEKVRQEKHIRTSQEAEVILYLDSSTKLANILQSLQPAELSSLFMTSHVYINTDPKGDNLLTERESAIQAVSTPLQHENDYVEEWNELLFPFKQEKQNLQQIIANQLQALKELDDTHEKDNIVLNDRMYQSYDTLSDDIHNHQIRLMAEKEQYEKEKVWITKVRRQQDEKVKLNVGGQLFETSLSTLRKDPNSILAYMFGGKTYICACRFL